MSGSRLNEPATGYIARDGAYVIRNDRTGVIVEVSDRNSNGMTIWRTGKDGIATWETVGAKTGTKVEEKFAGKAAGATINFGKVENQISHTFRHIDAAGIDRKLVQEAIQKDLSKFANSMPDGLHSSSVNVNGVKIDYNAFKLPDGSINVGRVTPPRNRP